MAKRKSAKPDQKNGAALGFEAALWAMADKMRGHMDAAEYKHVVLGLIFLKYVSDAFEEKHAALATVQGADPEDPDEYRAENIFWVPKAARWSLLRENAKQPTIGKIIDDAMLAIERDNPSLKGVLPKNYARPDLRDVRLGELIDLVSGISFKPSPPAPLPEGEGSRTEGQGSRISAPDPPSPPGRGVGGEGEARAHYRGGFQFAGLVEAARELRQKQTPAEKTLWELLRDRHLDGLKFRRQHQIGNYIADFFCAEASLVVELDGSVHDKGDQPARDKDRDENLVSQGFRVLRFRNDQVFSETQAVLGAIVDAARQRPSPLTPLPKGEGNCADSPRSPSASPLTPLPKGEGNCADSPRSPSASPLTPLPKGEGNCAVFHRSPFASPSSPPSPLGRGAGGEGGTGGEGARMRAADVLGRVYEYFLSQFASAEGKKGGQFYTPRSVVRVLVEMLAPYKGRVFDPCCGSGGMFVQSEKFIEAHGGRLGDIAVYGQESNPTTWRLAKMNLAIRGIDNDLGAEPADSFHRDLHRDLKADFILANPPFNSSDWGGERLRDDPRWKFGAPPAGNANFAWVQHFLHHLAPTGIAGFVLANGSMSSNQSGEGEIRRKIVEADLVDCMVALPGQLFYSTQIPACLWFLARDKAKPPSPPTPLPLGEGRRGEGRGRGARGEGSRDRRGEVLFIDARKMGYLVDRVRRDLTDADIAKIAGTYHAWRGDPLPSPPGRRAGDEGLGQGRGEGSLPSPTGRGVGGEGVPPAYADIPGFCKSATIQEIAAHGFVLTPGRYVGAEEAEDDGEAFEEKMKRLVGRLEEQFKESRELEDTIREKLGAVSNAL